MQPGRQLDEYKCDRLTHFFKDANASRCECGAISAFPMNYIDYNSLAQQEQQVKRLPGILKKIAKAMGIK